MRALACTHLCLPACVLACALQWLLGMAWLALRFGTRIILLYFLNWYNAWQGGWQGVGGVLSLPSACWHVYPGVSGICALSSGRGIPARLCGRTHGP